MIESMVSAIVANIAAEVAGRPPTARATLNAICLADMGNEGIAFVALPELQRSEAGAIVTIGAQTALKPGRNAGPYAAAKAAVATWSLALAAGLKADGVRVNCVLPGTLDTAANRETMPDAKRDAWVEPEALGRLIVYLCSPASTPLTGTAIPIG